MPKVAKELGPLEIQRLAHPGGANPVTIAVGGVPGLHIRITPAGAKSWLLRVVVGGKRRNIGLGSYGSVKLKEARDRARDIHDQIWRGLDPVAERRAAHAALRNRMTFAEAVDSYVEAKASELRSEKYRRQWRVPIDTYAGPHIGDMRVDEIERPDILRVLQPIWLEKTETAKRLRQRIERVLDFAEVAGHRSGENPAKWRGGLEHILPAPGRVAKAQNWPALKLEDAAEWFADLRGRSGIATRALEFLVLTAARSGEVRGAVWEEIDLRRRIWTIPADRMKASRDHRVPLSEAAWRVLEDIPRFAGSQFVFPAVRGGQLSDMALSSTMRRMNVAKEGGYLDSASGRPAVVHGLRSTFRDWAAELTTWPRELAEVALAHRVGSEVELAYRRTDMVERRRQMMQEWSLFLEGRSVPDAGKVLPFKS